MRLWAPGGSWASPSTTDRKTILDKAVYNSSGEKIGEVADLIITPEKAVSYAIVGTGGVLGIAQHDRSENHPGQGGVQQQRRKDRRGCGSDHYPGESGILCDCGHRGVPGHRPARRRYPGRTVEARGGQADAARCNQRGAEGVTQV